MPGYVWKADSSRPGLGCLPSVEVKVLLCSPYLHNASQCQPHKQEVATYSINGFINAAIFMFVPEKNRPKAPSY